MKRGRSNQEETTQAEKRPCPETDLLESLTEVLSEIRSTPSTGEISAELMTSFKWLMLRIEEISSDETNVEGQLVKDESERCLMTWLEDLVAQCEADGELDDIFDFSDSSTELEDFLKDLDSESEQDDVLVAWALQQQNDDSNDGVDDSEGYLSDNSYQHTVTHLVVTDDQDEDDEEIIIVDDDEEDTLDAQHIQVMA